jgi:RNA polymerase sigma-70 factor (ECF subfamily)
LVKNDYTALRQFKGESSLAAYLTVITRRLCVRQLVKLRRESALGHVHAHRTSIEGEGPGHEPILARDEVERLLGMLEPRQADVVRLYHLEFQSYRDIAKKLGIEENSIGSILSRARRRLQAVVGSEPV